jgi:hypothetical protein
MSMLFDRRGVIVRLARPHGDLVIAKEEGGGLGVAQVVQDGVKTTWQSLR